MSLISDKPASDLLGAFRENVVDRYQCAVCARAPRQMPAPMPRPAPVTSATRPAIPGTLAHGRAVTGKRSSMIAAARWADSAAALPPA